MIVGLDLSINNTGMCIRINDDIRFFQITTDNKYDAVCSGGVTINKVLYNRIPLDDSTYHKDIRTCLDGVEQARTIISIINKYKEDYNVCDDDIEIGIEGLALHGTKVVELAELSAIIKIELVKEYNHGENIYIIPPTRIKSLFCGKQPRRKKTDIKKNTKELMIDTFITKFYPTFAFTKKQKVDDCVDAYAIVHIINEKNI